MIVNGQTTSFTYDAAGIRVKAVAPNGVITDYPFPGYEVENPTGSATVRLTFSIAGQAVALKVMGSSTATYYLYNDHLGSVAAMSTNGGGTVNGSTARYYPFGAWRTEPTAGLTDRGFTGHLHNNLGSGADNLGLVYMQARWYLPALGRFISADTLVPDPTNPQSYNRYSYVENRPLVAVDPTGHWLESAWDALNVGIGIASFVDNVKQGNYGWAAVDALGVVVDAAALVTPIVPGGVGAIIKGTRTVDTAVDAIQTVNQVSNAAQATNQAANAVQNADTARKINNRIVIGEGMEAVKAAAHKHGAKWYQAWSKNFLPENFDLDKSLARNERWIREKIQQGYEILDIGIDPIRSNRSPFYELEQKILNDLDYPTIPIERVE